MFEQRCQLFGLAHRRIVWRHCWVTNLLFSCATLAFPLEGDSGPARFDPPRAGLLYWAVGVKLRQGEAVSGW